MILIITWYFFIFTIYTIHIVALVYYVLVQLVDLAVRETWWFCLAGRAKREQKVTKEPGTTKLKSLLSYTSRHDDLTAYSMEKKF